VRFVRRRKGLELRLDSWEASVLHSLVTELVTLVDAPDRAVGEDPLVAMVGLAPGAVEPPADPALGRLLPDAYSGDAGAAAEFRRYTDADLRAGKRAHAETVLAVLEPATTDGGRLPLTREDADAWLGALNDLRLVLGTRLDVTEEMPDSPGDEARDRALHLYAWLGYLQESLLAVLEPRTA